MIKFSRKWAMPSHETFSIPCIQEFLFRYLNKSKISVDPFARNTTYAYYRNDLNEETKATYHLEANEFLTNLSKGNILADLVIFDPPYSARQIQECYESIGRKVSQEDTQGKTWNEWKRSIAKICADDAVVLSFGWSTNGMGKKHGFDIEEIMLVAHGGVHNDTICVAERKIKGLELGE